MFEKHPRGEDQAQFPEQRTICSGPAALQIRQGPLPCSIVLIGPTTVSCLSQHRSLDASYMHASQQLTFLPNTTTIFRPPIWEMQEKGSLMLVLLAGDLSASRHDCL